MKFFKTLMLAAAAAIAATAFAGIGTASATKLYSGATALGVGTEIVATLATGTSLKMTTTEGTTLKTCTTSSIRGKTTNAGGAAETVKATVAAADWTWSNCSNPTSTLEGGELEVHHIASTVNGTVTAKGFTWTTQTAFGSCTYTAGEGTHLGTLTGSTTGDATIDINAVLTRKTGLCPSSARWVATYTITNPTPLHVTAS